MRLLALALSSTLLAGCAEQPCDERLVAERTEANAAVIDGNNAFALDVYDAITMLWNNTETAMATVLHAEGDPATWHAELGALTRDLSGDHQGRGYTLYVANKLFGQAGGAVAGGRACTRSVEQHPLQLLVGLYRVMGVRDDAIDLVDIDEAPPLLRQAVFRDGWLLLDRDPAARTALQVQTLHDAEQARQLWEVRSQLVSSRHRRHDHDRTADASRQVRASFIALAYESAREVHMADDSWFDTLTAREADAARHTVMKILVVAGLTAPVVPFLAVAILGVLALVVLVPVLLLDGIAGLRRARFVRAKGRSVSSAGLALTISCALVSGAALIATPWVVTGPGTYDALGWLLTVPLAMFFAAVATAGQLIWWDRLAPVQRGLR